MTLCYLTHLFFYLKPVSVLFTVFRVCVGVWVCVWGGIERASKDELTEDSHSVDKNKCLL